MNEIETEKQTRKERIDKRLVECGWQIVTYSRDTPLVTYSHHAVREYPTDSGPVDYALFYEGKIIGIPSAFSVKALEHRALMAQKYERFRKFHISEVKERNFNLDIFWLKDEALDDAENLPEVEDLASDALTYLEAAADEVQEILRFLGNGVKA